MSTRFGERKAIVDENSRSGRRTDPAATANGNSWPMSPGSRPSPLRPGPPPAMSPDSLRGRSLCVRPTGRIADAPPHCATGATRPRARLFADRSASSFDDEVLRIAAPRTSGRSIERESLCIALGAKAVVRTCSESCPHLDGQLGDRRRRAATAKF